MAGWEKLDYSLPDTNAIETFIGYVDEAKKLIALTADIIDLVLKFLVNIPDPLHSLIDGLLKLMNEMVSSLLDDVGIYGLFVPVSKRFNTTFMNLGDITPDTPIFAPDPALNKPNMAEEEKRFMTNVNRYSGGNAGFYNQVMKSLYDKGDRNRPQFTNKKDYIVGVTLLLGTGLDPSGFLSDLWSLWGAMGSLANTNHKPKVPKPENLRAEAITGVRDNKPNNAFSVLLTWDTMKAPVAILPDYGNMVLRPKRRAIIMLRDDINLCTSDNVMQLFATQDLVPGMVMGNASVVAEGEFLPQENSKVLSHLTANPGETYYFAVAWHLEAWDKGDDWTRTSGHPSAVMGYWYLSNIASVVPTPILPGSTPPDWFRTPSVADIFPQLAYFVRLISKYIEAAGARLKVPGDYLKEYVELLREEAIRYELIVQDILDRIKQLAAMLNPPSNLGGVYVRAFYGEGGNQFFLSDLATSLTRGYENAPPYHRGDELTAGVILLAGGTKPEADAAKTLFGLLFGSTDDALDDLIDSIGDAITAAEHEIFNEDLEPQSDGNTVIIEGTTTGDEEFDDALEPLKLCQPVETIEVAFGDDLEPTNNN
jgi:hypothetical protein